MSAEESVLTPGGFRSKSLVHHVRQGQIVRLEGERMFLVDTEDEAGGITEIPPTKATAPPFGSGWIAFAGWTNDTGSPLSQFSSVWQVPPQPSRPFAQTIFLFNGMQPPGGNSILQPVLQWGQAAVGSSSEDSAWVAGCWYVTPGGHAFHSDSVVVQPGQRLTGAMQVIGRPGENFSYQCGFAEFPSTTISVQNIPELTWCCETLEVYNLKNCSDYPNAPVTSFSQIQVDKGYYGGPLHWSTKVNPTGCGEEVVVANPSSVNGEVDIYYRGR